MAVELLVEQVPQTQASSSHLLRASSSQPRRYHKTASYTMACKALHASNFPFKMGCWGILGERRIGLVATKLQAAKLNGAAQAGADLERAVRDYVRTYAVLHGKSKAAEALGVSRHTLWRFLNRGHTGRAIPRAVLERVAGSAEALDDAEERLILQAQARRRLKDGGPVAERRTPRPLREGLEDTLRLLCAAPLATVDELSRFGRIPASTMRDRLKKLADWGLVGSVPHHLGSLGPHPKRRYFPTERGIVAGGRIEHGTEYFLSEYPVST